MAENVLYLRPAVYSKGKTANEIIEHIKEYPEQLCNTELGVLHTLEFNIIGSRSTQVGSLSEISELSVNPDTFYIYPLVGDGIVKVKKEGSKFISRILTISETQQNIIDCTEIL